MSSRETEHLLGYPIGYTNTETTTIEQIILKMSNKMDKWKPWNPLGKERQ